MHIITFDYSNSEFFTAALNIRTLVFVEEQHVDAALEYDGNDSKSIHYLLYVDDIPVGTARRRDTEDGIKLERLAILRDYRGKGYANDMMVYLLNDISRNERKIYLHAQKGVEDIYKKHGFKITGEKFIEAGIEHYKMEYQKNENGKQ
jgi:predicted GNAT family N-acyltransferase